MKKFRTGVIVFCLLLIVVSGCDGANADTPNILQAGVAKDVNLLSSPSGTVVASYQNITSEIGINGVLVTFVDTSTGKRVVLVNVPVSITER